ncbi:hypothetical protein C6P40_001537 [Pichia californica]|uniref:Intimal thickness related receptor IRP domain-containing protein n=1 Tax=Pichia californica TaxID=460514 RepID=A0A9P6WLM9_9ASCO|nr:hypothetical protein C6P42_001787 [[Candida] californica]KAG0687998.1 hypothetical protein C6P40_001537 [[Candida] californica]
MIFNSVFILLSCFISSCIALTDYYTIKNNEVLQTCAYVSNSDSFFQKFFYVQEPSIKIHLNGKEGVDEPFEVYTLIMGGEDMNKVTIGLNPYVKICDEFASVNGFCQHESDEIHLKKQTLPELIDSDSFTFPIESFMLNTKNNEEDHIYTLDKSSVYCIMFLTSTLPQSEENLLIEVDWKQSFGKLLVSDFTRMFNSLYFTLLYSFIGIYLLISVYFKIKNDNTSISLDSIKYKKYLLQYKFIIFHWGTALIYFATMINYLILNKFGYSTNSIILPISNLICLSLTTILTVWVIYNLMLMSAGAWFGGLKNSNLKYNIAKFTSIALILEMLIYDMETASIYSLIGPSKRDFLSIIIYIEYLIIYIISIIWAILTSYNIKEKKLKNIFYITIGLLTFCFAIILFGAHIFSSTVQSSTLAYTIEFVFSLIITLLWNNVIIENNEIQLKV